MEDSAAMQPTTIIAKSQWTMAKEYLLNESMLQQAQIEGINAFQEHHDKLDNIINRTRIETTKFLGRKNKTIIIWQQISNLIQRRIVGHVLTNSTL
jgi:hypothetical protein